MSLIGTLFGMVDRPATAMQSAAQRSRAWLLPGLLLVAGMVLFTTVSAPHQIAIANERSAQVVEKLAASMSAEQAQAVRAGVRTLTPTQYWLSALGVGLLLAALGWVARGAVVHFSSMAAGGSSTWGSTFAVGVWSMLPFFVRDVVQSVYIYTQGRVLDHQGLSFLLASGDWLQDSRNLAYAALANIDPFALWHVVLLGIGISVATRLSRTTAMVMSFLVFGAFLVVKLIPVALGSAVMGNLGQ